MVAETEARGAGDAGVGVGLAGSTPFSKSCSSEDKKLSVSSTTFFGGSTGLADFGAFAFCSAKFEGELLFLVVYLPAAFSLRMEACSISSEISRVVVAVLAL